MKRLPGLWILLSAGVLWLSLQNVDGIRATSLIFGKSSTTTTTTEATASESSPSDETATEVSTETSNVTKPTLTGIPQIDYIWDPNLPKELNGYNLSEYPFYERVPEDIEQTIDFKCDGLHDGFYASVPHKCQVYHHCLFGTRYDFLCANYTAFDQKTFICHFVSEVDCVNSKKYWHRNDALYQAASTTTLKPVTVPTPQSTSAPDLAPTRRPEGRRRPSRRRRPQYDYYDDDDEYDDYYEERPRYERRRKRPRPRPRPVHPEDYEEDYEDERYERRNSGRRNDDRRKHYNRRGDDDRRLERRRNQDRRKYADEDVYEDDDKLEEDRKIDNKRPAGDRRYNKRRPDDEDVDRRRTRPKGRPLEDDYEEEVPQNDKSAPALPDDKPIIKPTSGSSIYDRPRAAPKIKPPVPKNEANKYAYKPMVTKAPAVEAEDEEYYDDYEEVAPKKQHKSETSEPRRHTTRHEETRDTRKQAARLRPQNSKDEIYEEETPRRPVKPRYHRDRPRVNSDKKPPPAEDDYEEYEEASSKERSRSEKPTASSTTTTARTTTTVTSTTTPKPTITTPKDMPKPETVVRIVKRPFLPSRGGNPYSSRGLQPVGVKAVDKNPEEETDVNDKVETMEVKPIFKPSPMIIKMPHRQKYAPSQTNEGQEEFTSVSNRPQIIQRQGYKPNKELAGPRTTQKPKLPEPDPLDNIEDDEYDVTLNDALNPTLPNLPVRGFPTGFSSANDYNYSPVQRPRYVLEGASSDYVFHNKPVRQRFETIPYTGSQDRFVNTDADYKGQFSTINGQSYRPRVTQAYYSSF